MAGEIVQNHKEHSLVTVKSLLESRREQIRAALPKVVSADRFIRVALTTIQANPQLARCSMKSLVAGVMRGAQLGLSLDPLRKEAYLVPYKTKTGELAAQFIVGYRGLMKLAYATGKIKAMWSYVVREKDEFELRLGTEPTLKHLPYTGNEFPGQATGVYAVAVMDNGERVFRYLPKWEVEMHRSRSRAATEGPWVTDWEAMAQKTAFRVLANMLPQVGEEEAFVAALSDEESQSSSEVVEDIVAVGEAGLPGPKEEPPQPAILTAEPWRPETAAHLAKPGKRGRNSSSASASRPPQQDVVPEPSPAPDPEQAAESVPRLSGLEELRRRLTSASKSESEKDDVVPEPSLAPDPE